jgi:hypothetical protein
VVFLWDGIWLGGREGEGRDLRVGGSCIFYRGKPVGFFRFSVRKRLGFGGFLAVRLSNVYKMSWILEMKKEMQYCNVMDR